ncbi:zinc finger protein 271-like isoform X2 [Notolabrus celidotus]|uniref:zinc finger protein 271-like isoform X2 n=1 Tax=Notolabrus celidotus TaxID=1203425 RepID=UPI0014908044|nr:zinc finger protein 271-like isoform X2 [Notolabrus celidotus]
MQVLLELCRNDSYADQQTFQHNLSEMNTFIANQDNETSNSEVKASVANFVKLVHTLVENRCQKEAFYQNIFPTVFGPKYDSALQALMKKFLFNLQKLLPVPSLEQTSLWLSLSPAILKECVDFINQPQPLKTLIQHHKHHGHKVPQAFSSSGDHCILSSLSFHLPKVDNDKGYTQVKSEPTCDSQDWQMDNVLYREIKKDNEEDFKVDYADFVSNVEEPGQQCVNAVTEDQGASVEVILPSFDETESSDDDLDKKWFHHLKTGRRTSTKTFKCHVCGKDFSSCSRLKKHKITHRATKRMSQEDSASQSRAFEKMNLYSKRRTCSEDKASRGETELSSFASATTPSPSCHNSRPNCELSSDDCSLVCQVCDKVFTCSENFDKHQQICADRRKRPKTDPQCSSSSAHLFELNAVDKTKKLFPSEMSHELPEEISSHLPQDQKCKRHSRIKQCSKCREIFTCSTDLIRHMKSHTEQSPFHCSSCDEEFDSYEDHETHKEGKRQASNQLLEEYSSSNENKRNRKNTIVSSKISLTLTTSDAPEDLKTRKPPLTCQECGLRFTYSMSFEKHQKKCSEAASQRKTSTNYLIICGCDLFSADNSNESNDEKSSETVETKTATTPSTADDAGGSQHKTRTFKCGMCDADFSKIELLKKHYSESHDFRGPYPCTMCKRSFLRLCELIRHQQNKPLFLCPTCKKGFREPGEIKRHEKIHTARANVTPFVCETCGRSFKFRVNLIMHQRKHRERPPNVCSYCGKQFSSKDSLKAHMVRHTDGYPCPVCGKKFYQKTYLTYHLNRHTGQENYLCETCGKGWPTAAQLKVHMVKHTEGRPFKCDDCGATYKWESGLIAHHRAKHVGLRPFVCEFCSKAFRINSELKKHMMVHTGERPFSCPMCGKKFTKSFNLKKHREKPCL